MAINLLANGNDHLYGQMTSTFGSKYPDNQALSDMTTPLFKVKVFAFNVLMNSMHNAWHAPVFLQCKASVMHACCRGQLKNHDVILLEKCVYILA